MVNMSTVIHEYTLHEFTLSDRENNYLKISGDKVINATFGTPLSVALFNNKLRVYIEHEYPTEGAPLISFHFQLVKTNDHEYIPISSQFVGTVIYIDRTWHVYFNETTEPVVHKEQSCGELHVLAS